MTLYSKIDAGDRAPSFTLPDDSGAPVSLESFRGKRVVLYFYPKDATTGCTIEACEFNDLLPRFSSEKAVVLGVSPDSVKSHAKFKAKYALNFQLLADTEHQVAEAYGVWAEKSMYGNKYWANMRTTYVIDARGVVEKVWEKVAHEGHAAEVNAYLRGEVLPAAAPTKKAAAKKAGAKKAPAKKVPAKKAPAKKAPAKKAAVTKSAAKKK